MRGPGAGRGRDHEGEDLRLILDDAPDQKAGKGASQSGLEAERAGGTEQAGEGLGAPGRLEADGVQARDLFEVAGSERAEHRGFAAHPPGRLPAPAPGGPALGGLAPGPRR